MFRKQLTLARSTDNICQRGINEYLHLGLHIHFVARGLFNSAAEVTVRRAAQMSVFFNVHVRMDDLEASCLPDCAFVCVRVELKRSGFHDNGGQVPSSFSNCLWPRNSICALKAGGFLFTRQSLLNLSPASPECFSGPRACTWSLAKQMTYPFNLPSEQRCLSEFCFGRVCVKNTSNLSLSLCFSFFTYPPPLSFILAYTYRF